MKPNNNSSLNNFNFDFDLGSNFSTTNRSQPLKDQKQPQTSSYTHPKPASSTPWTPNKPSWTHQPAPSQSVRSELLNHTSMVGDIHGKSWASKTPNTSTSGVGIPEKNPNLFSDLLGSALGQSKTSGSNVPLKNAAPVLSSGKGAFPKTGGSLNSGGNWGSAENLGSYSSGGSNGIGGGGGGSMKSGGLGVGVGVGAAAKKKDPFVSLVDFGSKKEPGIKANVNVSGNGDDHLFGDFQNAGKTSTTSTKNDFVGANSVPTSKNDDFGSFQDFGSQTQPQSQPQSKGVDPLDALFSSTTSGSVSAGQGRSEGTGNDMFSEMNDWGDMGEEFGGGDAGSTTELEGLPPPPAGVTASMAKNKGLDSYKQGQHADGIKWLSWAAVLLEKAGDSPTIMEVLSCRASCYKEVGEYKKAIADCTKILEQDDANVAVLLQRALLYESTEKYKLGAEDLRTVMKIDPGNRLARSTIHRLLQLAD